ncbi:dipeptide/oligopeptide/nickel ABC transporter permease/ATP-binding protein [Luethyella okanaganae]|uniref:Dipeptide/oligopeptide/nickel ABC transporter permease/ATP-binding protein n=1 Tax=Luethyella okanaganae TaxID=69372 RepID=A0ABW1VHM5_9MICO
MTTTAITENIDVRLTRRGTIYSRFLRRPAGVVALAIFLVALAVALVAPWIAPYDPNLVDLSITKAPPSPEHLMGGDSTGRDIFSRLLWGARTTLYGALVTIVTAVAVGVPTGVAAGYFGGVFDRVTTWISDALQAIPGMIILLIVAAGTRSDFTILMATIGAFMAPGYFRLSRSTTLAVRNEAYVDAARVAGLTNGRIMSQHVVKAVYAPVIIQTALTAGIAMGIQAGLQFLGIGDANTPGWGAMMNDGFRTMLTQPLILLWPSVALGLTIAALAIIGSTLADLVSVRTPTVRRKRDGRTARSRSAAAGASRRPGEESRAMTVSTGVVAHAAEKSAVRVENLRVSYAGVGEDTEVVHGITLDVAPGEVLGIVGESGSGKSQTVFSILDLLPAGGDYVTDGIWIGGREVTHLTPAERHKMLGTELGYIPQEPMSNLDPSYTIGHQLMEPLRSVHRLPRAEARATAVAMLERVGIIDPARVMRSYPHQISGGMAQRVLIAGAIAGKPSVIVADEPTTALDVTVQAEVLELLRELQQEYRMALVLVTHNFGVVADICDRVVVMKQGEIVEVGEVSAIFRHPENDYTRELIGASLDGAESRSELDAAKADAGKAVQL